MNKVLLLTVLLVVLVGVAWSFPQIITQPRKFPGERRLGTINYGQYRFGKRGYQRKCHPRKKHCRLP